MRFYKHFPTLSVSISGEVSSGVMFGFQLSFRSLNNFYFAVDLVKYCIAVDRLVIDA